MLAVSATAQVVATGYAVTTHPLPAAAHAVAVMADAIAWFDGSDLMLEPNGQPPRSLLHFATPRFGSFTLPIDGNALLFGESTLDELWLVQRSGNPSPRLLTTIHFAYDAVQLGSGRALVSARTGGFGAGANDLIAVDLATGNQNRIGLVAGASGPLLLQRDGELVYATAPTVFPQPPAAVEIVRWSALQWALALVGGPPLTRANAGLLVSGIDSASSLAMDDDDDLFYVDWMNARVAECSDVHGAATSTTLIDCATAALSPASVHFVRDGGRQFEPFARAGGGSLTVLETDFVAATQLRTLTAKMATVSTTPAGTIPAGPFAFDLQDGPPSGQALFVIGLVRTGVMLDVRLPGYEQLLAWDAALFYPEAYAWQPCDATGHAALSVTNPGFALGLPIFTQVLFFNASDDVAGTTDVLVSQLGL